MLKLIFSCDRTSSKVYKVYKVKIVRHARFTFIHEHAKTATKKAVRGCTHDDEN